MLTISVGHSVAYLTDQVAAGRENYYTGAVAAGEPPGRWYGAGAEALGLRGEVDTQDMTALYEHFIDPRDEHFRTPSKWTEADTLGHAGRAYKSERELYAEALAAEPNATPERRAELQLDAGKRARKNVAFLDATFSVQKSVTVLHTAFEAQEVRARRVAESAEAAGDVRGAEAARAEQTMWSAHRSAVEDAIWAGNRAALDYLAEHAGYSRVGHHGGAGGRWIDAHNWTVASFFQHDSRDHDPQLHIHNAILNRVQGSDGQWRTLDGRSLYRYRPAAAAVGERTMEAHLTRALGVRFAMRPDGKAREIVGIPAKVMELFSSRRRKITRRTARLVEAFEAKFNREPNALELDRLQRQATFATRNAKSHDGETTEQRLERWNRQLWAEVAGGLEKVAADVFALDGTPREATAWTLSTVLKTALAEVQEKKAGWTEADLTRAISDALPDELGNLDGQQMARLLDRLTARGVALAVSLDATQPGADAESPRFKLGNGRSVFEAPGGRLYATPEHVHTERALLASTTRRDVPALATSSVQEFVDGLADSGLKLGADQAAALRGVLTSGASVESLVGPAGTGKSFVVGALAKAWQDPGLWSGQQRRVVGLAASQIATEVLAGEGVTASNITRWLAAQQRLAGGNTGGEDEQWRLRRGDLVVVDESAMANTADLAAIQQHVAAAGAKLLLTGDHRQLAAVGAGGGMEMLAEAGTSYELVEVRRFTHGWEREASLRLRDGDPAALDSYHKNGRLVDAGTVEQAEASASTAWLADTLAGRHSLLIVDTNEQAARLSAGIRAELVRLGKVDEHGVPLGMQGTYAGRGDLVQARMNAWHLQGFEGNSQAPINRMQYRVLDTRDDGGLVVAPVVGHGDGGEKLGDRMVLPGDYVAEHVSLAYASTVRADQGLTVDASHTVVTPNTSAQALYVGMTRGRDGNTVHVTTLSMPEMLQVDRAGQVDVVDDHVDEAVHRNPRAVLAGILDAAEQDRSALATLDESQRDAETVRTPAERLAAVAEVATAGRTAQLLDELVAAGNLTAMDRARLAAEDAVPTLSRLLRRAEVAGHDPRRVLADAVGERSFDGARQLTNVIHHRITVGFDLTPKGSTYREWTPKVDDPADQRFLDAIAQEADARRVELGEQVAAEQPPWAIEAFGPPPAADDPSRADWLENAATVAAHRELTGHNYPATAIGHAPPPGRVEAFASWLAASRALGWPAEQQDEMQMSDGQLHMRVRSYDRELAWAPPYVANELAGTRQAAQQYHQDAELHAAEAAAATDAEQRAALEQQAREAREMAELLDQQIVHLENVDQHRAAYLAHTAETRAMAQRAEAVLADRRSTEPPERQVTAEELLADQDEALRAEDPHRPITDEVELADAAAERAAATDAVEPVPHADAAETAVPDIRDVAAAEPAPIGADEVRKTPAEDTADYVAYAKRAAFEVQYRTQLDEEHAAEEARAEQLARWHADDLAEDLADEAAQVAEWKAGVGYA